MIILGIDPALNNTGVAVLQIINNSPNLLYLNTIKQQHNQQQNPDQEINHKLLFLHQELQNVLQQFQPHQVAMEETFVNVNPLSSLKLGQARGAIILTVAINNLHLTQYTPTAVKKTITGSGRADKLQVQKMLNILLPKYNFLDNDQSDALAVAFCHYQHQNKPKYALL
jgi:crossover junction endodeoxyribonuclease RuvC